MWNFMFLFLTAILVRVIHLHELQFPFLLIGNVRCAQLQQSRLTLCDFIDGSLTGSSVHGILQAKVLEWVASCRGSSWPRNQICISCIAGGFFTAEPPRKSEGNNNIYFINYCGENIQHRAISVVSMRGRIIYFSFCW